MINCGWRSLIIEKNSKISVEDENLVVETSNSKSKVSISQIAILVLNDEGILLSTRVLIELTKHNVKIIFCNEKHSPECEVIPYYANSFVAAQFSKQISWKETNKSKVWQRIVYQKIRNQAELIKDKNEKSYELMNRYLGEILPNDDTNRESQAARIYFNTLFGKDFNRRDKNSINAALNYGYSILLSTVNRFVSIYGYHTALGIKHCSVDNPYNLSCDLMEPFRPIIDAFVYKNQTRELDIFYKREIISLMYSKIMYGEKKTTVILAIEEYVKNVLDIMSGENEQIGEIKIGA